MGFEEERRNTLQYPHIRFIFKKGSEKERGAGIFFWGGGGFYPLYGGERQRIRRIKADRAPRERFPTPDEWVCQVRERKEGFSKKQIQILGGFRSYERGLPRSEDRNFVKKNTDMGLGVQGMEEGRRDCLNTEIPYLGFCNKNIQIPASGVRERGVEGRYPLYPVFRVPLLTWYGRKQLFPPKSRFRFLS